MAARIPDAALDQAVEALRRGATMTEAAAQARISRAALSNGLRRRGLSFAAVTPRRLNYAGQPIGVRARRHPCRYGCGALVTRQGAACPGPDCQRRRVRDNRAQHPEWRARQRVADRLRADDARREEGRVDNAPDLRAAGRSRNKVTLFFAPDAKEELRRYAQARRMSMSHVVMRALREAGVITEV